MHNIFWLPSQILSVNISYGKISVYKKAAAILDVVWPVPTLAQAWSQTMRRKCINSSTENNEKNNFKLIFSI